MTCTKKKTEKKVMAKRRKMTVAATVLLAGAIAIGTASYHAFRKPRPKSDRPEDIAKFVASSGFNRLSAAERQAYLRKLRPDPAQGQTQSRRPRMQNMSGEERSAFMANMMRLFEQERSRRLKKYFALRTQEEKNAFLDAELAKMEQRRAEFEKLRRQRDAERKKREAENKNGQTVANTRPRSSEAERASRMRTRTESTSPESRAMNNQYMRDLQSRAKATGRSFGMRGPRMAQR